MDKKEKFLPQKIEKDDFKRSIQEFKAMRQRDKKCRMQRRRVYWSNPKNTTNFILHNACALLIGVVFMFCATSLFTLNIYEKIVCIILGYTVSLTMIRAFK